MVVAAAHSYYAITIPEQPLPQSQRLFIEHEPGQLPRLQAIEFRFHPIGPGWSHFLGMIHRDQHTARFCLRNHLSHLIRIPAAKLNPPIYAPNVGVPAIGRDLHPRNKQKIIAFKSCQFWEVAHGIMLGYSDKIEFLSSCRGDQIVQ